MVEERSGKKVRKIDLIFCKGWSLKAVNLRVIQDLFQEIYPEEPYKLIRGKLSWTQFYLRFLFKNVLNVLINSKYEVGVT